MRSLNLSPSPTLRNSPVKVAAVPAKVNLADRAVDNVAVSGADDKVGVVKVGVVKGDETNLALNRKRSKTKRTPVFSSMTQVLASPPPWPKKAWRSAA